MYRSKMKVVEQVLELTKSEAAITSVLRQTNMSHSRFNNLLDKLISNDLIVKFEDVKTEPVNGKTRYSLVITEKGRLYLDEYKRFYNFAKDFGMAL